jgi:hypothetical protein
MIADEQLVREENQSACQSEMTNFESTSYASPVTPVVTGPRPADTSDQAGT